MEAAQKKDRDPDPRKIFLQDFSKIVEDRIRKEEELIIGMNANDADCANSEFEKFHINNDLVDGFAHLHPNTTPPPTYQRGNNRLDYIFITPSL
eukprot:623753-Ditylum_brightwellii.AAC.1